MDLEEIDCSYSSLDHPAHTEGSLDNHRNLKNIDSSHIQDLYHIVGFPMILLANQLNILLFLQNISLQLYANTSSSSPIYFL